MAKLLASIIITLALSSSGAAGSERPTTGAEADVLKLTTAFSHSAYNRSSPATLLLKVDFESAGTSAKPPLNIALVLDRSSSMSEHDKFNILLDAAREVIVNLSDRDWISVIAFNEDVLMLSPAGRAVNKPFLLHRLGDVIPKGWADLSSALLEAAAQVNSQGSPGATRKILVLTDGKANRGVSESNQLREMIATLRTKEIEVSTVGFGPDANDELLTVVADAGGGRYTRIRSRAQIPNMLKEELNGLLPVVAQNVKLEIAVERASVSKVFGQILDGPVRTYQANIGNLRTGERGGLLLALKPVIYNTDSIVGATATLTFDDPQAGQRVVRVVDAQSRFALAGGVEKSQQNQAVIFYGGILGALEMATEGAQGYDRQRYREALTQFAKWHRPTRQFALSTRNQDLLNHSFMLKHLLEEMEAADAQGKMHDHTAARESLKSEGDYRRFLLFHHQQPEKQTKGDADR